MYDKLRICLLILQRRGCSYSAQYIIKRFEFGRSNSNTRSRKLQRLVDLLFEAQQKQRNIIAVCSKMINTENIEEEEKLVVHSENYGSLNGELKFLLPSNQSGNVTEHLFSCNSAQIHSQANLLKSEKEILKEWKSQFSQTQNYFEAIFVLGPMGSGKTKTIMEEFKNHKLYGQYAYVDTDEIMELIEGFDEKLIDLFYHIARRIAIQLTDWLLEQKISFVAEGTCVKYDELADYMIRLKEKGYKIKVTKIDYVPIELTIERARKRARRRLSDKVVRDIFIHSQKGLTRLYEINKEKGLFEELQ